MFNTLKKVIEKPKVYEKYTAEILWNDPHISKEMLKSHLNEDLDLASRNKTFIDNSVRFIKERFDLKKGKSVIDFGCGPGLYTTHFAKLGAEVRGIDFSENSIAYARNKAVNKRLKIEYLRQNYLHYGPTKTFDLATLIFCDYCALSDLQRKKLLEIIKNSIKSDGYLFMDVCSLKMYEKIKEGKFFNYYELGGFWSQQEHFEFKTSFLYDDVSVSLDHYTIIEKNRTFEVYNWLKYFEIDKLKEEFSSNGLEVIEIYGDVTGSSYNEGSEIIALVARKKKNNS